ncbi:MAG: hypothetical protein HZA91_13700 [Verrucomicrobia bacterium]|nr:hypothetical protein [Verrucomicrobiota bacterium]
MKKWLCILCVPLASVSAQIMETNQPAFAAEWRVTGFVRQGQHQEASIERTGLMARFVREGDRLPGNVIVMEVDYDQRSVRLSDGKETAVIRADNYMAPPPQPAKGSKQKPGMPGGPAGSWQGQAPGAAGANVTVQQATAIRGADGKWNIHFPNGRSYDMQGYTERHGGVKGAIQHVKELMANETDAERLGYRKEQLKALKSMQDAGMK